MIVSRALVVLIVQLVDDGVADVRFASAHSTSDATSVPELHGLADPDCAAGAVTVPATFFTTYSDAYDAAIK